MNIVQVGKNGSYGQFSSHYSSSENMKQLGANLSGGILIYKGWTYIWSKCGWDISPYRGTRSNGG